MPSPSLPKDRSRASIPTTYTTRCAQYNGDCSNSSRTLPPFGPSQSLTFQSKTTAYSNYGNTHKTHAHRTVMHGSCVTPRITKHPCPAGRTPAVYSKQRAARRLESVALLRHGVSAQQSIIIGREPPPPRRRVTRHSSTDSGPAGSADSHSWHRADKPPDSPSAAHPRRSKPCHLQTRTIALLRG